MKKIFKVALVAICITMASNFAKAQVKVGYVNFNELVQSMTEFKGVQAQIETYRKQYVDEYTTMTTTFQAEAKDYQAKGPTMTDAARTSKETELQDMQKRLQDYQTDAQQKIEAKSNELFKPLSDKAHTAVTDVAKEKGYGYVFDSSQGAPLIVSPPADDLLAAVKLKLGVK